MKPQGTSMRKTTVSKEGDALRDIAEAFIHNVYAAQPALAGVPSAFSVLLDWPIEL